MAVSVAPEILYAKSWSLLEFAPQGFYQRI
jgi:hypothetical protein